MLAVRFHSLRCLTSYILLLTSHMYRSAQVLGRPLYRVLEESGSFKVRSTRVETEHNRFCTEWSLPYLPWSFVAGLYVNFPLI